MDRSSAEGALVEARAQGAERGGVREGVSPSPPGYGITYVECFRFLRLFKTAAAPRPAATRLQQAATTSSSATSAMFTYTTNTGQVTLLRLGQWGSCARTSLRTC